VTTRLPDAYFDDKYAEAADPWQLEERWYERRKYAITLGLLPHPRYRHAFEPGCSIGVLTEHLTHRCDHVTATDVATVALDAANRRLVEAGSRERVALLHSSLDEPWPATQFDLVVLSEIGYYLEAAQLRTVLDREVARLARGTVIIAAHWRHRVDDYPITGDHANDIIGATPGLHHLGGYLDADVVIEVFDTGPPLSVAARTGVPGA
jgi:predicted TPR repeat methyltransferase